MSKKSIGVFDSGIGGSSIWKEIHKLLPFENTVYLADSANAPYGHKSKDEIINLCKKNTDLLLKKDCKMIVVACNTATTNAIKELRETYAVPFIGIEPAIKPAALQSKHKAIGILATKGTLSSELFLKTSSLYTNGQQVIEQVGEGLVELIEEGKINTEETKSLLKRYLQPMIEVNIDYLVLGCSHYPYLMPLLIDMLPNHVKIIDSGEAVARQTKAVLEKHNLLNTQNTSSKNEFYTNGNPEVMAKLLDNKSYVEFLVF